MKTEMSKLIPVILMFSCLFSCGNDEPSFGSTTPSSPVEEHIVYGNVLTSANEAVEDVILRISVKGTFLTESTTDENGRYEFKGLETGSYEMLIVPPSDSYVYDGEKIRFTYLNENDLQMRDITLRKTNFVWGELN